MFNKYYQMVSRSLAISAVLPRLMQMLRLKVVHPQDLYICLSIILLVILLFVVPLPRFLIRFLFINYNGFTIGFVLLRSQGYNQGLVPPPHKFVIMSLSFLLSICQVNHIVLYSLLTNVLFISITIVYYNKCN